MTLFVKYCSKLYNIDYCTDEAELSLEQQQYLPFPLLYMTYF